MMLCERIPKDTYIGAKYRISLFELVRLLPLIPCEYERKCMAYPAFLETLS